MQFRAWQYTAENRKEGIFVIPELVYRAKKFILHDKLKYHKNTGTP